MASTGIRTPNLPLAVGSVNELLGNQEIGSVKSTVRVPLDTVAGAVWSKHGPDYETRTELFADLNWGSGTVGFVWGDSTTSRNGVYKKSGSSGTGSWTKIGDLPGDDTSAIEADIDAIQAELTAARNPESSLDARLDTMTQAAVYRLTGIGGSANAITASAIAPDLTVTLTTAMYFTLTPISDNTANVTLAIPGLSAQPLTDPDGQPLLPGDLDHSRSYILRYSGTTYPNGHFAIVSGEMGQELYKKRLNDLDAAAMFHLTGISGTNTVTVSTCTPDCSNPQGGYEFRISFNDDNTGAMTLRLPGLNALPVNNPAGAPMIAGDVQGGRPYILRFNGTYSSGTGTFSVAFGDLGPLLHQDRLDAIEFFDTDANYAMTHIITGISGTNTLTGTLCQPARLPGAGVKYRFSPAAVNTGAMTLKVPGDTLTHPIEKFPGKPMEAGDIAVGREVVVRTSGTSPNFSYVVESELGPLNLSDRIEAEEKARADSDTHILDGASRLISNPTGVNDYVVASSADVDPQVTALLGGMSFRFTPPATNTSPTVTLDLPGFSKQPIVNPDGDAFKSGELVGGRPYILRFGGTYPNGNFRITAGNLGEPIYKVRLDEIDSFNNDVSVAITHHLTSVTAAVGAINSLTANCHPPRPTVVAGDKFRFAPTDTNTGPVTITISGSNITNIPVRKWPNLNLAAGDLVDSHEAVMKYRSGYFEIESELGPKNYLDRIAAEESARSIADTNITYGLSRLLSNPGNTANNIVIATADIDPFTDVLSGGMSFRISPASTNTGQVTLKLGALNSQPLVTPDNDPLKSGELVGGRPYILRFSGTYPSGVFRITAGDLGEPIYKDRIDALKVFQDGVDVVMTHQLSGISGTNTIVATNCVPDTVPSTGRLYWFQPVATNTGAMTLTLPGLPAPMAIKKYAPGLADMAPGDIQNAHEVIVRQHSSYFLVLNEMGPLNLTDRIANEEFVRADADTQILFGASRLLGNPTGTANAITIAAADCDPATTSLSGGMSFRLSPIFTNTGPVTLKIGALTAQPLTSPDNIPLNSGELVNGRPYVLRFSGSYPSGVFRITAGNLGTPIYKIRLDDMDDYHAELALAITYNLSSVVGTNTLTATSHPPRVPATGDKFKFVPAATNTGAVTMAVGGGTAIPVRKYPNIPLSPGDLQSSHEVVMKLRSGYYDIESELGPLNLTDRIAAEELARSTADTNITFGLSRLLSNPTGTANAITIAESDVDPATTTLTTGMSFRLSPSLDSTGAVTLKLGNLNAQGISDPDGAMLRTGDLQANRPYVLRYHGVYPNGVFRITSGNLGPVLYNDRMALIEAFDVDVGTAITHLLGSVSGVDAIVAAACDPPQAPTSGIKYRFLPPAVNTGPVTLAIPGSTALPVYKYPSILLEAGDIVLSKEIVVRANGTPATSYTIESELGPKNYRDVLNELQRTTSHNLTGISGTNAISASNVDPDVTTLLDGMFFRMTPVASNTITAVTLDMPGSGIIAQPVVDCDGVALKIGDFHIGRPYMLRYTGTYSTGVFRVQAGDLGVKTYKDRLDAIEAALALL